MVVITINVETRVRLGGLASLARIGLGGLHVASLARIGRPSSVDPLSFLHRDPLGLCSSLALRRLSWPSAYTSHNHPLTILAVRGGAVDGYGEGL